MKANGSPAPFFETDENRSYFLTRLPVHDGYESDSVIIQQETEQVTEQVMRLLEAVAKEPLSTQVLLDALSLNHRPTFIQNYLQPALDSGAIEMTQPDSPRSPTQKYRLTDLGKQLLNTRLLN